MASLSFLLPLALLFFLGMPPATATGRKSLVIAGFNSGYGGFKYDDDAVTVLTPSPNHASGGKDPDYGFTGENNNDGSLFVQFNSSPDRNGSWMRRIKLGLAKYNLTSQYVLLTMKFQYSYSITYKGDDDDATSFGYNDQLGIFPVVDRLRKIPNPRINTPNLRDYAGANGTKPTHWTTVTAGLGIFPVNNEVHRIGVVAHTDSTNRPTNNIVTTYIDKVRIWAQPISYSWEDLATASDQEIWEFALNNHTVGDYCRIAQGGPTNACNYYVVGNRSPTTGYLGVPRNTDDRGTGCSKDGPSSFCYFQRSEYDLPQEERDAMCTSDIVANTAAQIRHGIVNGYCV